MSPTELPRQRLYAVVPLATRPDPFHSYFIGRKGGSTIKLPRRPRSAELIVHCEWGWSLRHSRIAAWYLYRSKTHWVLWLRNYDDNWETWDWSPVSAVPLQQARKEEAATHLLIDAWKREAGEWSMDRFHWINETSLLAVPHIKEIAREVWG